MQWILDESVSAWDICWEKRNTVLVPLDLNMEMKPKHSWTGLKQKERNQVLVTLFELLYQSMSQLAFGFLTARPIYTSPHPPFLLRPVQVGFLATRKWKSSKLYSTQLYLCCVWLRLISMAKLHKERVCVFFVVCCIPIILCGVWNIC